MRLIGFLACLSQLLYSVDVEAAELVLVTARETVHESASMEQIRELFIGKRSELNKEYAQPIVYREEAIHERFLEIYIRWTGPQFDRHWKKMLFSGKAVLPKETSDMRILIRLLLEVPGSISYMNKEDVTEELKIIATDQPAQ